MKTTKKVVSLLAVLTSLLGILIVGFLVMGLCFLGITEVFSESGSIDHALMLTWKALAASGVLAGFGVCGHLSRRLMTRWWALA